MDKPKLKIQECETFEQLLYTFLITIFTCFFICVLHKYQRRYNIFRRIMFHLFLTSVALKTTMLIFFRNTLYSITFITNMQIDLDNLHNLCNYPN